MTQETKQIFSIRTFKTGTHSALLAKYGIALAASAVLMGAATVSADEVTTPQTQTATEQVAQLLNKHKIQHKTSQLLQVILQRVFLTIQHKHRQ